MDRDRNRDNRDNRDRDRDRDRDNRDNRDNRDSGKDEDFERSRLARIQSGVCFDWEKGRCSRGSSCKFQHNNDGKGGRSRSRSRSRDRNRSRSRSRDRNRSRSRSGERPITKIKSRAQNDQLRQERLALVKRLTQGDDADDIDDNTKEIEKSNNEEENEEDEMMKMMGFGGFNSTKGKIVYDNHENASMGAVSKHKIRKVRQYMNRKGGFNRLLDPMN